MSVVSRLKGAGIRAHLATNKEIHRTQSLVDEMGLGDMFDQVFSSCRIGYPKPSKGYFESIVYKLESTPSSILLWDDRPHNIEEARRFGLSAELYTDYDTFVGKMKENIPSLSDSL